MSAALAHTRLGSIIFSSCLSVSPFRSFGPTMKSIPFSPEPSSIRQTIKEDKALIYEDWKECIEPLFVSASLDLNPEFFGIEQYFAARSLIASRSFQIDDFHGSGMVPLADLFNHKTGAEDVHFTSVVSQVEYDQNGNNDLHDDECENQRNDSLLENGSDYSREFERSTSCDDLAVLEMIMVKDVKAGNEVFNTYGSVGNAALLHRYGFAEADNPYDILNIDLELVQKWSFSLYSPRHSRRRLSLWRRLDCSGCFSQNSEYFEISFEGKPQVELLVLLYIMLLSEEGYNELDLIISSTGDLHGSANHSTLGKVNVAFWKNLEFNREFLRTKGVRAGLLSLADIRGSLYGPSTLEDDIEALNKCSKIKELNLYHSLVLRISERKILERFRSYASSGTDDLRTRPKAMSRKRKVKTCT